MTKYREIIRLAGLNLSQTNIALSCSVSKTTVNKVLKAAKEKNIPWPLDSGRLMQCWNNCCSPKWPMSHLPKERCPTLHTFAKNF